MLERKQKGLLLELPFNMLLGKQRSQHISVVTVTSCHHGPWHQQDYSLQTGICLGSQASCSLYRNNFPSVFSSAVGGPQPGVIAFTAPQPGR